MSEQTPTSPDVRTFTTTLGGVMTREVGAITGDVEVWLDPATPDKASIRYAGAEDVYTVTGDVAGRSVDEVVQWLGSDPGNDADGNPRATDLEASAAGPADDRT